VAQDTSGCFDRVQCCAWLHRLRLLGQAYGGNKDWVNDINVHDHGGVSSISALMLAAFASGLGPTRSAFSAASTTIRATHQTSNLNDLFFVLGFALRTRSLRAHTAREHACCCRAASRIDLVALWLASFLSHLFGALSMYFPAILLLPAWAAGGALLVVQCRTTPASHYISLQKTLMGSASMY